MIDIHLSPHNKENTLIRIVLNTYVKQPDTTKGHPPSEVY